MSIGGSAELGSNTFPPAYAKSLPQDPSWPAGAIVVLLVVAIGLPPGLITLLNLGLLLLACVIWMTSHVGPPRELYGMVLPFFAICLLGLVSGVGADVYLYFKDVWYVCNPALIICSGYVLYRSKPDLPRILRAVVVGGAIVGTCYIIPFMLKPALLFMQVERSRQIVGTGYYAPALALIIVCACWRDTPGRLLLPRWAVLIGATLCIGSIVLTFSRTIVIVSLIGLMANWGLFARRALLKFAVLIGAFVALVLVLKLTVDVDSFDNRHSFLGKMAHSLDEMAMHEYVDRKHINESYRGYESARVLSTYEAGDPVRWVIGQGFGALVDLKVWVTDEVGRYIPIMHNGYLYLLFKGGGIAIVFFGIFLRNTFVLGKRTASSAKSMERIPGRLLQGIALVLAVTTWVMAGVFNRLDLFPFLLCAGLLCGHLTVLEPMPAR